MSEFLPNAPVPTKPIRVPQPNTNTVLTPEELEGQRRFLSHPETFPDAFKAWLIDFIAVNGSLIPASQIHGWSQFNAIQSQVLASESTSSATYTNLSTTGPSITGLADGTYLLLFGAQYDSPAGNAGYMSPSINGATPDDNDAAVEDPRSANRFNIARAVVKTISNNNNNSITMKYKVPAAGSNSWAYRWLVVFRISN